MDFTSIMICSDLCKRKSNFNTMNFNVDELTRYFKTITNCTSNCYFIRKKALTSLNEKLKDIRN